MGWETRGGRGAYYTRSKRVNGRVRREYVGGGIHGERAALIDAARRAHRETERAAWQAERDAADLLAGLVADHGVTVDGIARAALVASGFRQHHRGEWRRRRG